MLMLATESIIEVPVISNYEHSVIVFLVFVFSSRRRHTRYWRDWSSDVCSSDLGREGARRRRRDRRRRARRRPPRVLLRAGPLLPRRLARRAARGVDHPRAPPRGPRDRKSVV